MNNASPTPARNAGAAPAILVAGGDPDQRTRLCDWLGHEFPGHPLLVAAAYSDVRHAAIHGRPAVALVSIDTPGLKGFDMLRLLRTLAPRTASVALSAYHADTHREYAMGAGAVTCVSPQVVGGDLRHLIGTLLQSASPRAAP